MKRYAVHLSATVIIETENVAQAVRHAARYKLISPYGVSGGRAGSRAKLSKGELRAGRPIWLDPETTPDGERSR